VGAIDRKVFGTVNLAYDPYYKNVDDRAQIRVMSTEHTKTK
jgi:hypothetical protein